MAAGKVITGYSLPYVAKYSATGCNVTYSGGMRLSLIHIYYAGARRLGGCVQSDD